MEDYGEYNVKVYSKKITDDEKNKIQKELQNSMNFEINSHNVENFVDCNEIIGILKENSIPYKIEIEGTWTETVNHRQVYNPNEQICFYIKDRDYPFYKSVLENMLDDNYEEEEPENEQDNDGMQSNIEDDFSNIILKNGKIFVTLIIIIIGIISAIFGIRYIRNQDIFSGLIFIVLSLFFFFTGYKVNKKDNQKTE